MKKTLALSLIVGLLLTACSSPSAPNPNSVSSSVPTSSDFGTESSASMSSNEASGGSQSEETTYYFKDNVLKISDATIEITDYKVIPAGEAGNKYGEKPVIAFWFTTTNTSDEPIRAGMTWAVCITAIQDNDPNIVNELEVGSLPDDRFLDTQFAKIKPGGTLEDAIAYELDDVETPVILKATRGIAGDELGEIEFSIK